jgi:uncharacterized protein
MTTKHIGVYHSPCSDGTACAWIFQLRLTDTHLIPFNYGKEDNITKFTEENETKEMTLYFFDMCTSFEMIKKLASKYEKIVIIDHHKSNLEELKKHGFSENEKTIYGLDNVEIIFSMEKAGCELTWEYFYPKDKTPWFISYIADRDLWKWKLPYSKEVNTALFYNNGISLSGLEKIFYNEYDLDMYIDMGKIILEIRENDTKMCSSNARQVKFKSVNGKDYNIWLCQSPRYLRSEVGNYLALKQFKDQTSPDFVAIYYFDTETMSFFISLRNIKKENCVDLSIISKEFGGGGHKNAAGFSITSIEQFKNIFSL